MSSTTIKNSGPIEKVLKTSEVRSIMRQCKASGITDFSWGSLHIKRSESVDGSKDSWTDFTMQQPTGTQTVGPLKQSARKLSEEVIDQLKLTDPAGYERLILSGELDGDQA